MITADEALKTIQNDVRQKNSRSVAPVPKKLMSKAVGKPIKIYNISPYSQLVELGSLGTHLIQACKPGQKYSTPRVIPAFVPEAVSVDMNRSEQRLTDGMELALDILGVGSFKNASQDLTRVGVFIAANDTFNTDDPADWIENGEVGDAPTEKELAKAHARYSERCAMLVREADEMWAKGPLEIGNISPQHRDALAYRAEHGQDVDERAWYKPTSQMEVCPACQKRTLPPGAIKHADPNCGAIVDWAKAVQFGLVSQEQADAATGKKKAS